MKYKLVIFDFDGTLADTSEGILNSIRYTRKMMNLPPITEEQMYSHVGPPMEVSYNHNFGLTGERLAQAVNYHKEYAIMQGYKELRFYDGIAELLDSLRKKSIKTAVATLKSHTTAVKILQNFNLAVKFDYIAGTLPEKTMSKAEMLNTCVKALDCKITTSVLVGDSEYDAVGAEEAGMDFIAVTYGFGFKTETEALKFTHVGVCCNPMEVLKIIELS